LVEDDALADVALDLSVASRSTVLSWVAMMMTTTTTTMLAKVSVPVDLVCEKEHDPFRGVDNEDEDDDDDDEEPVPPQGDDESNLAVEPAIHNPDPAMEDLVEGLSRLSLRTS
jgi:hypothetical protein